MQLNNITNRPYCQEPLDQLTGEILCDKTEKGKERPWREKKVRNMKLAEAYDLFDSSKAARLRDCAKYLKFRRYLDGTMKLHHMNSCRVRLCPVCAWRRSLRTYYNNLKIVRFLKEKKDYQYIFVTLTVRNCRAHELKKTIDDMQLAINRFNKRPEILAAFKGTCRCLEITHNVDVNSPNFDTYHPHFHMICAVNPTYFKSKAYLSQARLTELWASCLAVNYTPVCNIKRCYGSLEKAVAESSKYATKDVEYILPDKWDFTVQTVKTLDDVLRNRRLVNYTGIMREAKAILKLEDEEKGNLIDVGEEMSDKDKDEAYTLVSYYFYNGYRQYISIVNI